MIYIVSYANDHRGTNTHYYINDYELIKINNEVMQNKDCLISFNIKYKENEPNGYNNPIINFYILNSKYEYKKKTINNYQSLLFEYVRNEFKNIW